MRKYDLQIFVYLSKNVDKERNINLKSITQITNVRTDDIIKLAIGH